MLPSPFLTPLSCLASHSFTGPFTSDCAVYLTQHPLQPQAQKQAPKFDTHTLPVFVCGFDILHHAYTFAALTCRRHADTIPKKTSKKTLLTKGTSLVNCCVRRRRPTGPKKRSTRPARGAIQHHIVTCQETRTYRVIVTTAEEEGAGGGETRRNVGRAAANQRPSCANMTRFPAAEHAHIHALRSCRGAGRRTTCTEAGLYRSSPLEK